MVDQWLVSLSDSVSSKPVRDHVSKNSGWQLRDLHRYRHLGVSIPVSTRAYIHGHCMQELQVCLGVTEGLQNLIINSKADPLDSKQHPGAPHAYCAFYFHDTA